MLILHFDNLSILSRFAILSRSHSKLHNEKHRTEYLIYFLVKLLKSDLSLEFT